MKSTYNPRAEIDDKTAAGVEEGGGAEAAGNKKRKALLPVLT